jgi:hypothetical protein
VANPTTNYGFVLPTPTDLVTDLPADFDVALQGVDTRLKALQPGTTLGDLAYSSATANTNTRLPIGTSGQVLAVSGGGEPAWTTTADVTPLTTKGDLFTFTTVDARIGVGANGTILTADSAEATGMKWVAPAGGGKVLQVINAKTNTETSTSSSSYSSMGLSATITPSSVSSKILILASVNGIKKFTGNGAGAMIRLNRAGGVLFDLELYAGNTDTSTNNNVAGTSTSYLDSPATTSATTYDITIGARASINGILVNNANSNSTITLMEIGA